MTPDKWKLLLVDDEEDFVTTLAERLELRGISAKVALDGVSALRAVAERTPHVVVLDMRMPGMKGLDVLRAIKGTNASIQVILLTGEGNARDGIEGMRFGAFDYLTKPVSLEALLAKIAEAAELAGALDRS